LAAMFLLSMCCAHAQDPLPRARPEAVGLAPEKLERIAQVLLRADTERGRLPGAVVAIARKGRLAYYAAFGYLEQGIRHADARDAIFAIASMNALIYQSLAD
jgi:CubicO group peptidase (beta-lactamase class C family)